MTNENGGNFSSGESPGVDAPAQAELNSFVGSVMSRIDEAVERGEKSVICLSYGRKLGYSPPQDTYFSRSRYFTALFNLLPQINPSDFPTTEREMRILETAKSDLLDSLGVSVTIPKNLHLNSYSWSPVYEVHNIAKTDKEGVIFNQLTYEEEVSFGTDLEFFTVNMTEEEIKLLATEAGAAIRQYYAPDQ